MAYTKYVKVLGRRIPRKLFFELLLVVALVLSAVVGIYAVGQRQKILRSGAAGTVDCSSVSLKSTGENCLYGSSTEGRKLGCYDANGSFITSFCVPKDSISSGAQEYIKGLCQASCEATQAVGGATPTPAAGGGGEEPVYFGNSCTGHEGEYHCFTSSSSASQYGCTSSSQYSAGYDGIYCSSEPSKWYCGEVSSCNSSSYIALGDDCTPGASRVCSGDGRLIVYCPSDTKKWTYSYDCSRDGRTCGEPEGYATCVGGGTPAGSTPTPTPQAGDDLCSSGGDCFAGISNCGEVGRDLASGDTYCTLSGAVGMCCVVRPDLRFPPDVKKVSISGSGTMLLEAKRTMTITPTVQGGTVDKVTITQKQILGLTERLLGRTGTKQIVTFGPNKADEYALTSCSPSCTVEVWGNMTGLSQVTVDVRAVNENGQDHGTGTGKFRVKSE